MNERRISPLMMWWTMMSIYLLVQGVQSAKTWEAWYEVATLISVGMILKNMLVIAVVIALCMALRRVHFLRWSIFHFFTSSGRDSEDRHRGMNISLMPAFVPWAGLIFLCLFYLCIPALALQEEKWFRDGTASITGAVLRSIAFGFAHCLVGVPLAAGLALSVTGLWFSYQYMCGGLLLSAAHHTVYNFVVLTVLAVFILLLHVSYVFPRTVEFPEDE